MREVRPGDLAVVVAGLWPNVGRVVYVASQVSDANFIAMGIFTKTGWRVRCYSETPLERIDGPAMAGLTPTGSLRPLKRLPPKLQAQLEFKMALADLADCFMKEERTLEISNGMNYESIACQPSGP